MLDRLFGGPSTGQPLKFCEAKLLQGKARGLGSGRKARVDLLGDTSNQNIWQAYIMQAIPPELVIGSLRAQIAEPESASGPGRPSGGNHLGDLTGLEVDDFVGREFGLGPCSIGQGPRLALNNRITLNPTEFGDPAGQIWANS